MAAELKTFGMVIFTFILVINFSQGRMLPDESSTIGQSDEVPETQGESPVLANDTVVEDTPDYGDTANCDYFALYEGKGAEARRKRSPNENVQDFIEEAIKLTNERRAILKLPQLEYDTELTIGAQEWAEHEAQKNKQEHSCEPCEGYSEVLAHKRTKGKPIVGSKAAKWAVDRWYGEDPDFPESDVITEVDLARMGFGIAYRPKSGNDDFNHIFAVARFSRKH